MLKAQFVVESWSPISEVLEEMWNLCGSRQFSFLQMIILNNFCRRTQGPFAQMAKSLQLVVSQESYRFDSSVGSGTSLLFSYLI